MQRISKYERRCSELDTIELPPSEILLDWRDLCTDFVSTERKWDEVAEVIMNNPNERIDLRPYMILSPMVCTTTDRFQKVLDVFRFMQLRMLCVISPVDGSLQGVITRENLFAYMSL